MDAVTLPSLGSLLEKVAPRLVKRSLGGGRPEMSFRGCSGLFRLPPGQLPGRSRLASTVEPSDRSGTGDLAK